jgi:hypothetical protein
MRAKSNQTLARPTIESYSIEWSAQAIPPEGSIQIFNEYARAPWRPQSAAITKNYVAYTNDHKY